MATISLDQPNPALGDTVTFSYTTDKHEAQLRIQLVAWQPMELGKDGQLVYGADQEANTSFLLGSVGSTWLDNGGPAHCRAVLYHNLGKYESFAELEFDAG